MTKGSNAAAPLWIRSVVVSRVVDILQSGGVLLSTRYADFSDVVEGLVDGLVARGQLDAQLRDEAVRAVCEREALSSTIMVEIGVSIPHARVEGVRGVVGAIAVSPGGVFQAMAGVPISIVVLVLSAPDMAGDHLNVLAGLSMLLQSEVVRSGLADAADEAAAIEILREHSARRSA